MLDKYIRDGQEPSGYPGGKIVELHGPPSSGKTGLALAAVAEAQQVGGMGVYISPEGVDENYASKTHKVILDDPERWSFAEVFSLEAGCAVIEAAVHEFHDAEFPVIVVVDSLSALGAAGYSMDNHNFDDNVPGAAEAKLLHRFFRRGILYYMSGSPITLILIRHSTENPGPYKPARTTHGLAPDYHTWLRLRLKRKELRESESGPLLGYWITATCTKSKLGRDSWSHSMPQYWDGFDRGMEVLTYLIKRKLTKNSKGYIWFPDHQHLGKRFASQWRKLYWEDANIQAELNGLVEAEFLREMEGQ